MAGGKKTLSVEMRLKDFASKNIDKIRGKMALMTSKMVKGFKKIGGALTSVKGLMVGFIAVLAVRRVASFVIGIIEAQDALSKMAKSVESTTEDLSLFMFAMERSGLQVSKAATLLRAFGSARSFVFRGEAKGLVTDQKIAFEQLGVSIQDLKSKGAIEIIRQIADGIQRLGDTKAAQTALSSIFPKDFLSLIILLGDGAEGFDKLTASGRRFGAELSTIAGENAEAFIDALTNFQTVIKSTFRDIINKFLPAITARLAGLNEVLADNRQAFIDLAVSAFELVQTIARETFGAVFATFEAINDLLNRTRKNVLDDIADTEKRLAMVAKRGRVAFRPDLTEGVLNQELADLEKELATQFPDITAAAEKFAKALENIGIQSKAAGEDVVKGFGAQEDVTALMLEKLKEYNAELAITQAEFEKIRGQSQNIPIPPGFKTPISDEQERAILASKQPLPPGFIGAPRPDQPSRPEIEQLLVKTREVQKTLDDLSIGEGFLEGIRDATSHLDSLGEAGAEMAFALTNGIGGAFDSIIEGTNSAKEAFKQFAKFMLKEIAKIIVQLLIARALQAAFGIGGAVVSATAPGPGTGLQAAKGGVFPEFGGRFGHGGIAPGRSQLINVGDGGRREAVVPLPDNRSIPVELRGDGGFNITNNFHFQGSSGESLEQVRKNHNQITAIITSSIRDNKGGIRRTIQEIGK